MEESKDGILDVQMLGGFTLSYEGQEKILGRNSTSKFIQLLQLVWLSGPDGITKNQLMGNLYEWENLANLNNSFNNLLYQMRRQMVKAGLPEADYICRDNGKYCLDQTLPIRVDAVEFERLVHRAEAEEEESERYRLYAQAADLYKGELLPALANETWVAAESFRYQKLYERTILWLGEYYKRQKDFGAQCRVYSRAAEIYPYDEWQIYQIESLLGKGEYKEAYFLYDKTVKRYSEEMGLPPSKKMLECYEAMSRRLTALPGELTNIKEELREKPSEGAGGVEPFIVLIPAS